MTENRRQVGLSKFARFGAGFIALCGLIGVIGASFAMVSRPEERGDIAVIGVADAIFVLITGYIALTGKPPALPSRTSDEREK